MRALLLLLMALTAFAAPSLEARDLAQRFVDQSKPKGSLLSQFLSALPPEFRIKAQDKTARILHDLRAIRKVAPEHAHWYIDNMAVEAWCHEFNEMLSMRDDPKEHLYWQLQTLMTLLPDDHVEAKRRCGVMMEKTSLGY